MGAVTSDGWWSQVMGGGHKCDWVVVTSVMGGGHK